MRTEILNYLQAQNLGVVTTSHELPWNESGLPLYLKNLRKVYVDRDQVEVTPLVTALDSVKIYTEVTSVTVYLGCDAKNIPPNLDQAISIMREAKNITTIAGVNRRDCSVSTSYENDILVTELVFSFTKYQT